MREILVEKLPVKSITLAPKLVSLRDLEGKAGAGFGECPAPAIADCGDCPSIKQGRKPALVKRRIDLPDCTLPHGGGAVT